MRRLGIITALLTLLMAVSASVALAVAPGTYPGAVNPANAPSSSHLASGTIQCVVAANLDITCSDYVLGGVGHTNADVNLSATYSATIDCTNKGGNTVESHTAIFSDTSSGTVRSAKNGQLSVPAQSVSAFEAPQVCPNPNWKPSIRAGTLVLESFSYTLTFEGFDAPAVSISASDP
jgi:hypothetical protein